MPSIDLRQLEPWLKQAPMLLTAVFAVITLVSGIGLAATGQGSSQGSDTSNSQPSEQAPTPDPLPENKQPGEWIVWNTPELDENGEIVKENDRSKLFSRYSTATAIGPERDVTMEDGLTYPDSFVGGTDDSVILTAFTQNHNKLRMTIGFEDDLNFNLAKARVGILVNGAYAQVFDVMRGETKEIEFDTNGAHSVQIDMIGFVENGQDSAGNTKYKVVNPNGVVLGTPEFGYFS